MSPGPRRTPLRADLARHCLRLDLPFHKTHTPGELIERVDGDVATLGTFFSQMAVKQPATPCSSSPSSACSTGKTSRPVRS